MGSEIELVSDGGGLAVIGNSADVERFILSAGLDKAASKDLDLHRLWSFSGTGGAAAQIGADLAANSGRWVKLTAESAEAVKKYGLMPTKTPGVSHAMIGEPGDIKQWLQITQAPDDRPHSGVRTPPARRHRGETGEEGQPRRDRQGSQGGRAEGPRVARGPRPNLPAPGRRLCARTRPGARRLPR